MSAIFDPILWRLREWDTQSWSIPWWAIILQSGWRDASTGVWPWWWSALAWRGYIVTVAWNFDGVSFGVWDIIVALVDNASTTTFAWNRVKIDNQQTLGAIVIQPDSRDPSINNEYPSSTALKGQAWRALVADTAGSVFFDVYDMAVALVDNPWLTNDADWTKIKYDVNLSIYVPAFTTATNSNQVAVSDGNGARSIHFTPVRIDSSGNITSVTQLSANKFAVTVNETAPTTWFYYTDFIQNGLTWSSNSTADMANLFTGMYWFASATQTKNTGWFGLSGNHIFVWQQWAGKVDGIQAVAWSVFVNNTRQVWDAATFRWFITNRGHIDSIAFFAWETNTYIWPAGTIDNLYAMHFKPGDLLNANASNTFGIIIEDDVRNLFGWEVDMKSILTSQTEDFSWLVDTNGHYHDRYWYFADTSTDVTTLAIWWSYRETVRENDYNLISTLWLTGDVNVVRNASITWVVDISSAYNSVIEAELSWSTIYEWYGHRSYISWEWTIGIWAHFSGTDVFFSGTMFNEYAVYFPWWSLTMWWDIRWLYFEDNIKHKLSWKTYIQVWWSANFAETWILINSQYNDVWSDTNPIDLMIYSMPWFTLAEWRVVKVNAGGTYASNANVKYIDIYFGTSLISSNALTLLQAWDREYTMEVISTWPSTQKYVIKFKQTWSQETIASWTCSEVDGSDIIIKCASDTVAVNDIVQWRMTTILYNYTT